ncbi:rhodanese-like domain-containing protein [Chryseobacterium bernardetii]|uniref:Rhodanese-like domain-containing protein n=1 Tax=Chryseobacterium bernardetii TaxID=1241978 RepID=A0A3G6TCI6_9FLAO|nr:rhodanese-like domain-containing protein [Chryseobacterium bernardetii]AZB26978.1 rhodanese-like domain-containing protein [Chryseobacterium bernardetii]AZB33362.1 rhodanese-like domain-containing protein [Chryseobacterium bernardetii]
MLDAIKNLFGMDKTDYADLVKQGAVIVDVRSKSEYAGGHIKGSLNIPVDQLDKNLSKLSKDKTIITCCASGMRSASAKSILQNNGYKNVHNGGGWMSLNNKI